MELTREQTIEALECCRRNINMKRKCGRCPLRTSGDDCDRELNQSAIHYLTEDKAILATSRTSNSGSDTLIASNSYRDKARPAEDEKEPAPAATGTSPMVEKIISTDNDTMIARICQEGILNLLDTLLECNTVEKEYIEGYLKALADILHLIKEEKGCQ